MNMAWEIFNVGGYFGRNLLEELGLDLYNPSLLTPPPANTLWKPCYLSTLVPEWLADFMSSLMPGSSAVHVAEGVKL